MPGTRPGMTLMVMRAFAKKSPEHLAALDRVREWVRARFARGEGAILVAEVACAVPGCPPIETVIAFWSDERRHHFKVFLGHRFEHLEMVAPLIRPTPHPGHRGG